MRNRWHNIWAHLTRICTQYVQMAPTAIVPMKLNHRPPHENASGMARIPVPSALFRRLANASESLQQEQNKFEDPTLHNNSGPVYLRRWILYAAMLKWIILIGLAAFHTRTGSVRINRGIVQIFHCRRHFTEIP